MSVYRMNLNQLMKFISLYRDSECLWNVQNRRYKDRDMRDLARKHIAEEMKIPNFGPKEVAQKIKNIRTTYKQELNKIKKSEIAGCSPDDIYKPKLQWFQFVDSFLNNIIAVPTTASILETEHIQLQIKNEESYILIEDETFDENYIQTEQVIQQTEDERDKQSQSSTSKPHTPGPHSRKSKKHNKEPQSSIYITEAIENLENIQTACSSSKQSETEFDIWAKSLAMQLNAMELHRALNLQLQMQILLSNERLAYESSKAGYSSSSQASWIGPDICSSSSTHNSWLQNNSTSQWQNNIEGGIDKRIQAAKNVRPPSSPKPISPGETDNTYDSFDTKDEFICSLND